MNDAFGTRNVPNASFMAQRRNPHDYPARAARIFAA